jgi:hypothetical protein
MAPLHDSLMSFNPVTLKKIGFENLLRRYDTKFILPEEIIPPLLETLVPYYQILEIDNKRIFEYENLYFDSDDLFFYLQHHNRNFSRYKIRYRRYLSSNLVFFEVKCKSNKGRTVKERIEVDSMSSKLSEEAERFAENKISDNTGINLETIMPKLWTRYHRISLVNQFIKERLTIDLNLSFEHENSQEIHTKSLVIAEAKQEKINVHTPFMQCIRKARIRRTGFSKYCAGTALLNHGIKKNRFKPRLMALKNYLEGV